MHDASASFSSRPDDRWYLPARAPAEVICHGDVAPCNSVLRDGVVVGFIDFDTAHPGPRWWDVAYAVYRFAPLHAPSNPDADGDPDRQWRMAGHFCAAYGLPAGPALLEALDDRLTALIAFIERRAAAGDAAFAAHVAAGDLSLYRDDLAYLAHARTRWLA
jgi:Ser/Thr protein kinase RdoA (MazF antagonist)